MCGRRRARRSMRREQSLEHPASARSLLPPSCRGCPGPADCFPPHPLRRPGASRSSAGGDAKLLILPSLHGDLAHLRQVDASAMTMACVPGSTSGPSAFHRFAVDGDGEARRVGLHENRSEEPHQSELHRRLGLDGDGLALRGISLLLHRDDAGRWEQPVCRESPGRGVSRRAGRRPRVAALRTTRSSLRGRGTVEGSPSSMPPQWTSSRRASGHGWRQLREAFLDCAAKLGHRRGFGII